MLGLTFGYSGFITAVIGQLLDPISQANGWTRTQTNGAFSLALAITVLCAPVTGALADRLGAHNVLLFGTITLPLAVATLAMAPGSVVAFYMSMALVAASGSLTLPAAYTSVTLRWFDQRRGFAFGIALSGVGLSQVLLPPVIHLVLDVGGWREAVWTVAALMMAVTLPLNLLLRLSPSEAEVDGGLVDRSADVPEPTPQGMVVKRSGRAMWQLLVAFTLLGPATYGLLASYPALLRDAGFEPTEMVRLIGLEGGVMIVARLASGWMLDHLQRRLAVLLVLGPPIVGILLIMNGLDGDMFLAIVATTCIGVGIGGEMNFMSYFVSRFFARASYAKYSSITYSAFNVGGILGAPALGLSFDKAGSFALGLAALAIALLVATALMATMPDERRR